ncbi:LysR substrate-binding domain-containing protein [Bradyrhizobium sp. Arg237L]|nr:LysR substrate-binding domain-containing protein [Bradyrhizobium sp. Arg237L]MDI4232883.1 LysR substrate-binding domain-containing protein [Bradyrhizobium sp. Arg237L]
MSRTRPRDLRRKTINCCRSTAFSASSRNFDLNGEARTAERSGTARSSCQLSDSNAASHSDQVFGAHRTSESASAICRIVDRYFRNEGLRPRIDAEANSNLTLFELIRQTDLATILPENVGGSGLSAVKMKPAFEPRRAARLRRRNAYRSAAARAFIVMTQQIVATFASG